MAIALVEVKSKKNRGKTPPVFTTYYTMDNPTTEPRPNMKAFENNRGYVVKVPLGSVDCMADDFLNSIIEVKKMGGSIALARITGIVAFVGGSWLCSFERVHADGSPIIYPPRKDTSGPRYDEELSLENYDLYNEAVDLT